MITQYPKTIERTAKLEQKPVWSFIVSNEASDNTGGSL